MQTAALLVAAALAAGPVDLEHATLDWPVGEIRPHALDSGPRANAGDRAAAVFSGPVTIDGAAWLRLYFGKVRLGPGSLVRMTSKLDNEVQELDATALGLWATPRRTSTATRCWSG